LFFLSVRALRLTFVYCYTGKYSQKKATPQQQRLQRLVDLQSKLPLAEVVLILRGATQLLDHPVLLRHLLLDKHGHSQTRSSSSMRQRLLPLAKLS
jgi:hypothetical protein